MAKARKHKWYVVLSNVTDRRDDEVVSVMASSDAEARKEAKKYLGNRFLIHDVYPARRSK